MTNQQSDFQRSITTPLYSKSLFERAHETELDLRVPETKLLVIRSAMSEQPTKIASTPLDVEFIVIACRVKADFVQRTLTMQLPFEDWLLKPQNERSLSRLRQSIMYKPISDTALNVVVDLGSSSDHGFVLENLHLMSEVGERSGLARGVILRIADSVNRIWPSGVLRKEILSILKIMYFSYII